MPIFVSLYTADHGLMLALIQFRYSKQFAPAILWQTFTC